MNEEDDFVRITLRLPRALQSRLAEVAAKKRSMNAEIIERLEKSFSDRNGLAWLNDDRASLTSRELSEIKSILSRVEKALVAERLEREHDPLRAGDTEPRIRKRPRTKRDEDDLI
ncbi:MAG: hypothetical protein DI565_14060 [Ancylobacter novellus]|uniref:Arc-like DNA binding domain-containing protein n=1 Tax=Ancylobacter novellus TaxID=921 RepID=A0A2W5K9V3_ANCNO|nr:MAG: hypothetical protein DI565_14060 [Ancylobacter novellus]